MIKTVLFFLALLSVLPANAQQQPQVLASVHPLALVAASVVDTDNIQTLVAANMSPHDFALRPSDIRKLQQADIILWSGPKAEPYLRGFVARWPDKTWINAAEFAPAGASNDPHWWLSPTAMTGLQAQLAAQLGKDPQPFQQQLQQALEQSNAMLAPVRQHGFFVFHRAYDHWVAALNLNQAGALTLSPGHKPGLKTMAALRTQLQQGDVHCVFSEPQYDPALVEALVKDLSVNRAELDPMATSIALQADGYVRFLTSLAERAAPCLTPPANHH
ncbi:hypothetical protein CHH28_04805 [Bacterioplanes sanyensis]|uniref:High-affinity zinc uptake system protein ZnuA n=1 Tax=Bacterioplanes sanyensis TaxID=1249553 RepID=A0A222FHZ8_9GAMM|nr:zinc ABC transporter substrate-binding protein [Bacterioplanes sanyensis]ASP38041.1 hypothetical protein CHH28_04805 [Bacterioplanes sanyensis]